MYFANCHCHSTFSDGMLTPDELCEVALREGYRAVILTDHDTCRGSYFMNVAARKRGLLNIAATEFYAVGYGSEYHILGFDYNPDNKDMKEMLSRASSRATIKCKFLFDEGILRGTLREGISWQDVLDAFPYNDYICNNQVFEVMVSRGIYERSEYFTEFLRPNFGTKVARSYGTALTSLLPEIPHAEFVCSTIRKAGGVPVVAHPHNKLPYVNDLLAAGAMGFEICHPSMTSEERVYFDTLCTEKNLYKMGGTDHSGALSGLCDIEPERRCEKSDGFVTEENFMLLYERRLG